MKIKKYMVISILNIFKKYNCKTIDDAINLLNKEIKNDTDIAFDFTNVEKEVK